MHAKHAKKIEDELRTRFEDLRNEQEALPEDSGAKILEKDADERTQEAVQDKQLTAEKQSFLAALEKDPRLMVTTAGSSIEGREVCEYKGTISCDGIVGVSVFATADAVLSDVAGDRSMMLARKVEEAKQIAWAELLFRAHKRGANGLIGVRYDVYVLFKNMIGASVTATAVKLGE